MIEFFLGHLFYKMIHTSLDAFVTIYIIVSNTEVMTVQRQTFRARFQEELKRYMRVFLIKLRNDMHISKENMAELLHMDVRSYSYIEDGTYLCGLITFIALLKICPNKMRLLSDIAEIFEKVYEEDVA